MIYIAYTGQSRFVGTAECPFTQEISPNIQIWKNNSWQIAYEPLIGTYKGPIMSFSLNLLKLKPAETIRLIPCAVSGTTVEQWQKGQTLYTTSLNNVMTALNGNLLSAVLFSQGEADTFDMTKAQNWATLALQFARDFRTDTGKLEVPFIYTQLGATPTDPTRVAWNWLRDTGQPTINNPAVYPNIRMVKTLDLENDEQHLTAAGYDAMGARIASIYYTSFGQYI